MERISSMHPGLHGLRRESGKVCLSSLFFFFASLFCFVSGEALCTERAGNIFYVVATNATALVALLLYTFNSNHSH